MAAFNSTLGGANSTSYISLATANGIFAGTQSQAAWDGFTDAEKEAGLMAATFWMETLKWGGYKCFPAKDNANQPQALEWPRFDASCKGEGSNCAYIPTAIQEAEAYLALGLAQEPNAVIPLPGTGGQSGTFISMTREKLGELEQEKQWTEYSSADSSCDNCGDHPLFRAFPWLQWMLGCWLDMSFGSSRVLYRVRS